MAEYKSGDIVRVFYPYLPKALNRNEESPGKARYGMIINAGNNRTVTLPIIAISSHTGRTRNPDYVLRDDEIFVPNGLGYMKQNKGKITIDGVIKTERVEFFDLDEISTTLTNVDINTKIDVLERYKHTMTIPTYIRRMNEESPDHKEVMHIFERSIIAEKLGFLTTNLGEFKYEHMEDRLLKLKKIQSLGQSNTNKRIHFYAVELTDEENKDSFFYTFATMKRPNQIAREWGKPKAAVDWLKEDERFYNLQRDIRKTFEAAPNPHPNKYKAFAVFRRNALEHSMER